MEGMVPQWANLFMALGCISSYSIHLKTCLITFPDIVLEGRDTEMKFLIHLILHPRPLSILAYF